MKHQVILGLTTGEKEEKIIVENIKSYLAQFNRTTSTVKKGALLEDFLPFRIKQFHWNLNKETGTFTSLFPNVDLDGRIFFPSSPDVVWLIHVLFHDHYPGYEKNKSEKFIVDLLVATQQSYRIVYETDDKNAINFGSVH